MCLIKKLITINLILFFLGGITVMKAQTLEKATFAGGCFWCMEPPFETMKGVKEVIAGYTGGPEQNPSYEEVASG
ncbi:MAG: methionine sulfoxide reductase, partial [Elusimicrobia bacterium]|nr:methionine sulfoxide reductase [Elusimicrobiota bacterium]MBD3411608.1 methionine sulfoxide reductase [Elusimicrobiota bacterium]